MDSEIDVIVVAFYCVDKFGAPPLRSLLATAARPFKELSVSVPRDKRMDPFSSVSRVPEATDAKRVESVCVVQQPFLWLRIHGAKHDG